MAEDDPYKHEIELRVLDAERRLLSALERQDEAEQAKAQLAYHEALGALENLRIGERG